MFSFTLCASSRINFYIVPDSFLALALRLNFSSIHVVRLIYDLDQFLILVQFVSNSLKFAWFLILKKFNSIAWLNLNISTTTSTSTPPSQIWVQIPINIYIYIYIFFFFTNSDYLGMSLVVQPLNEENYNTWNRSVIVALGCKNQDWFLLMVEFQSHNHHLILIMFLGVSAIVWFYLGCSIHFQGKFKLVWSTCKRSLGWFVAHMYSQGNGPRIFELRKQWVRNALRLFY